MFYVYNDDKTKIIAVSGIFNPEVEQVFDDRDIPLEYCVMVDGVLCDSREL